MAWSNQEQESFLNGLIQKFGAEVTRRQVEEEAQLQKLSFPRFIIDSAEFKIGRGKYNLKPKEIGRAHV